MVFNAQWNNKSPLPVSVDIEKTGLDIFILNDKLEQGSIDLRSESMILGDPIVSIRPYQTRRSLVLEPNAENNLQTHAVLNKGYLYIAQFKLYRKNNEGKLFSRVRYTICDLR